MNQELYWKYAEFGINAVPGIKRTGLKVLELQPNYAKVMMPLENNGNHVGMMYAGSLFTLGEFAGGIIHLVSFDMDRLFPLVKEINIRYRRPALSDITMEASITPEEANRIQTEALSAGKADYTMELELKDNNEEVAAIVKGVWQVRTLPEGMSAPFKLG